MYYYKVYCSYGREHKVIFYRTSRPMGDDEPVPIELKRLVDIYKLDAVEEVSRED